MLDERVTHRGHHVVACTTDRVDVQSASSVLKREHADAKRVNRVVVPLGTVVASFELTYGLGVSGDCKCEMNGANDLERKSAHDRPPTVNDE